MGKPKRRAEVENAPEPDPPFFDEEEREIMESYEAALERGEVHENSPEELAKINAEWRAIVEASRARKAISLRLPARDLELIKSIARRRGIPYQTLIGSVLHQFAHGALREAT
jgi:predicted DNA binding CopG/RHH family protein